MAFHKDAKIENLQLAIQKAEEAFAKCAYLINSRDRLQEQIDALHQHLEELKLSYARSPAPLLNDLIEKDKQLLAKLKHEKLTIDTFLDEIEEIEVEDLRDLKNELIEEICKLDPDRKARFQELETYIEKQKLKIFFWQKIKQQIAILNQLLSKIAASRKRFRTRGILAYIFGENPNFTITKQLKACELQAQELDDFLTDQQIESSFRESVKNRLTLFINECKNQWGFKKLDNSILPFQEVFKDLETMVEAQALQSIREQETLKRQLEKWLKEA